MPVTQIPPGPLTSDPARPRRNDLSSDLYDSRHWESAYREIREVPTLLLHLQDDLSRSRKREAFWISVAVHLALITLIVNSPKLEKYFPRRAVMVVSPNDVSRQKELTYLEMPPDAQKITKHRETDIISDKDRTAMSKTPLPDREQLKKLLDSGRRGRPGQGAPSAQPQPAPSSPSPAPQSSAQQSQAAAPPPSPPVISNRDQTAKLQTPVEKPKPSFGSGGISPGSLIEQAARAAAINRGGYGGDSGDFGLGDGRQAKAAVGPLDIMSDTMGVDFGPYLSRVLHDVRENWYGLIPEAARAPLMKRGKVSIEFAIMKDGTVQGMKLISSSGDVALDRGAWGGIVGSNPFPPLPAEFGGKYLALRFHFFYNPDKAELQ
ncbi:MAG: TonB family protein [Acidobacteriales bacterium]|nr:TonB family protein [Terriglobales bacterium]